MEEAPDINHIPALSLRLFGPVELKVDGNLVMISTQPRRELLALLAIRQGASLDRRWLAATIWPDSPSDKALSDNLRQGLHELRKALGKYADRLKAPTPRTLTLDLTDAVVD